MTARFWVLVLSAVGAAALGACSPEVFSAKKATPPGCGAGAEGIVISDAWVRAIADDRPMSAGYVTLCNAGKADDALVKASSPAIATVEIHETARTPQGVAGMRPVKSIALPAGRPIALAPGGAHLMLIGPLGPLSVGDRIPVTFEFASGKTQTLDVEIREGAANAPEHQH